MKTIVIIFLLTCPLMALAQSIERDVVASGGAYETSANMSLSYTVGEPVIETKSASSLVLTQGFQQSGTDTIVGIVEQGTAMRIKAYPNPTPDVVVLEVNTDEQRDFRLDVYDVQGKKQAIPDKELSVNGSMKKELDFGDLAAGNYFIRLRSGQGKTIKTIKVQKIY